MPPRPGQTSEPRSRLAAARVAQAVTQEELARVVGISVTTLARLERKASRDPRLGWYVNCATALGLDLYDILDDDQVEWYIYDRIKPPPADWTEKLRAQRARSTDPRARE